MNQDFPDWQTLNAYVDGELDATTAAAVAEAAGDDAEVAEQIAMLYQLKGVSHNATPEAPADLKDLMPAPMRSRRTPVSIAAVVAMLAVAVAAIWGALELESDQALPPELLASARTLHGQWLQTDASAAGEAQPTVLLAALSTFGRVPFVPDLSSTSLSIGLVTVADGPEGHMLHVGYRGTHGCHLSLFVVEGDAIPKAPQDIVQGSDETHSWRVRDLGYLLFAKGMDQSRFRLISEKVEAATRRNSPLDNAAQEQLAANKRQAESCHA
ncbi:hypothetical protein [Roseibium aggregatum]|uniref:Anti-sigma factor RsiW n=1 Tax=Roseibium aggregatum TaxID=187304 RepID=A0A926NYG6_9HYPH|nr:hypothetical protein [Roseibium aggregatum]MBD1545593.1 hypothetical protein [Roseibium aggregatum]